MSNTARNLPKSLWVVAASVVLMVAGGLGPWAEVAVGSVPLDELPESATTVWGTEGDGWILVGAAGLAALFVILYLRRRRGWMLVLPLVAGLAGVATTLVDLANIDDVASDGFGQGFAMIFDFSVSAQWGIYVALAGSLGLVLASIGLILEGRARRPVLAEETSAVSGATGGDIA
jgi:hypothetical protein